MKQTTSEKVDQIIHKHMMWSMGAGLIPVPLADFFSVGAVQLDLIRQMCKAYDIDFKEKEGKAIVSSLTSSLLAKLGARAAIKLIPGIGSIVGGLTMAVLSGASTYAIGHAFKTHFEKGGTILDIDLNRLKQQYHNKFEKGKAEAKKYQEEVKSQDAHNDRYSKSEESTSPTEDKYQIFVQKMKDLGTLKKEGLISEKEFNEMKAKFLDDL